VPRLLSLRPGHGYDARVSGLAAILRAELDPPDPDPVLPEGNPAAVMIPLVLGEEPSVLFTRRSELVRQHKGEISFPGGSRHDDDADLLSTALRETEEELGIPAERFEVLGGLPATHTFVSGFVIAPYVGLLADRPVLVPSPEEIAEVIEAPLSVLFEAEREVPSPGGPHLTMFTYDLEEQTVWGATGRILHDLLGLLRKGGWR